MTPQERQTILRLLKRGPDFGDRRKLAKYAVEVARRVCGTTVPAVQSRKPISRVLGWDALDYVVSELRKKSQAGAGN